MSKLACAALILAWATSSFAQESSWIWQFMEDEEERVSGTQKTGHSGTSIARLLDAVEGEGEGEEVSEAAIDVLGQSGKFSIFDKALGKVDANAVTVEVDALRELDAAGDAVGTSGSVKHSLETFASQDFTIHPAESAHIGSVSATMVSFDTPISSIGKLSVDTYIFKNGGTIGTDTESWEVQANDVKFNILLSGWQWCGHGSECQKGKKNQVGEFIDVLVKIKGKAAMPEKKTDGSSSKSYNLGGDVGLELSDRVLVDGEWTPMPAGFPKMEVKGSAAIFTFRFPKFAHNATYDPIVGFSDSLLTTTTTTTTTTMASPTPEPPTPLLSPAPTADPVPSPAPSTPLPPASTPFPPASTPTPPTSRPAAATPEPPVAPTPAPSVESTPSPTNLEAIALTFSVVIRSERTISELEGDQSFVHEMKKVGLKVLGLPEDKTDWITVAFNALNNGARRLGLRMGRRLNSGISVDYTAKIPQDHIDDVSIVVKPAIIEGYVQAAVTNAETASHISYGLTLDVTALNRLTNNLESAWTAAVASAGDSSGSTSTSISSTDQSQVVNTTTPPTVRETNWQPVSFAVTSKNRGTFTILLVAMASFSFF